MSKARDLANAGTALTTVSATELGYLDGVTSAVQTQINAKEATLPSQTGNTGKYLTTDGSAKSWGTVSQYALPTQTGNSGKYLTTNGTAESWGTVPTGGMTLLSTTTLSGASTTITGIDQNYKNLRIIMNRPFATTTNSSYIKPNSLDNAGTFIGFFSNYSSLNSLSQIETGPMSTSTSGVHSFLVDIAEYANTTVAKPTIFYGFTSGASYGNVFYSGVSTLTAAITSLKFETNTGGWSGGTVLIYGVK
jgi:hypothetical protein